MGFTGVVSVCPEVVAVVIFFSVIFVVHFLYDFLVHVLGFPPLVLVPTSSVVRAASATLILRISACRARIWLSFCLSCVVKFPLVVFISMIAASLAAVTDANS